MGAMMFFQREGGRGEEGQCAYRSIFEGSTLIIRRFQTSILSSECNFSVDSEGYHLGAGGPVPYRGPRSTNGALPADDSLEGTPHLI